MHGTFLAFAVALASQASGVADPVELVAELGSPRYARREAAEVALTKLGRTALPALRAAATSADPEVQARAAAVLRQVEGALLVEATSVALDFADVPLADAIATINRRAGLKLTVVPEAPASWADRRVTIRSAGPLPFWKAVDALCAAGRLHYVFGGQGEFELGDATFPLYDGFAASRGMFDDRGPFRVQLASLQYQSEVHLGTEIALTPDATPDGATTPAAATNLPIKQFYLQMLVGAEPRLAVAPGGPVRVLEAIDDRGQSLVLPAPKETFLHDSGYLGVNPSPLVHLRVDLAHPDRPGARLKRVKGLIPLVVSTRKPDPFEIPLADATSKTFRQGKLAIRIGEVRVGQPDQGATIDLTIKLGEAPAGDGGGDDAIREVASPQQLEVLDAAGRMIPWFPSSSFYDGTEARLTLTLLDRGAAPAVPTTLRYHGVIRDRTDVPFEFRDLPMP